MNLLEGRSVVVTGAGSGVGRASALLFARQGARVVGADVRRHWADETVAMIEAEGGTAVAVTCDVTSSDDVAGAVKTAVAEFGRLDVMYNNAGIASPKRGILLEEHTDEILDQLVAVNSKGVFYGCREAVVQFKAQGGGGAIVSTASMAGLVGIGSVVYGATKGFVIQLTRALAAEVAPFGIRVNCIAPGGMGTNFATAEEDAFRERSAEEKVVLQTLHPLGLEITAEDCAQAALFLASDMAANITGTVLPIDGGYLAK